MSIDFAALLGAIVIDDDNDTIIFDEGAGDLTATLTHGTFFVLGDGSADDVLKNMETAFEAAGSGNWSVATTDGTAVQTWNRDTDTAAVSVRILKAAGSWRVQWLDVLTTFPGEAIGFIAEKGAANTTPETSTRSPTHVWVGPGHIEDAAPSASWTVKEKLLANGDTDVIRTGDKRSPRSVILPMQPAERLFIEQAGTNLDEATLENFFDEVLDGRPVRFYRLTLQGTASSVLLNNPAAADLVGTYRLGEGAAQCLESPPRSSTGLEHYDVVIPLAGYVAP